MRLIDPERYAAMKATGKLPSPKGVAFSIIKLLQRDDFRISELVQLVQSDPAISGRLIHFSNAAAFGRSRPIVSVQRAIVALGSFRVRDLVIGLSVMHDHRAGGCEAFDYEGFWGHSLATGIACQELSRYAQISSEENFTIGLLARVGELAMASLHPDEYSALLLEVREKDSNLAVLEHEHFRMNHMELGATMLAEWGLPDVLIQAAYHHEDPEAAGFTDGSRVQTLTLSLNFASHLARLCMSSEEGRWGLVPELLTRAARLGIGGETLNDMADRAFRRWREWGAKLQVRTRDIPPFAEILASTPPQPRVVSVRAGEEEKANAPSLNVQLIGIPLDELQIIMDELEAMGHLPVLVDDTAAGIAQAIKRPAQVVILDMALPLLKVNEFCKGLRQTGAGKEAYALVLAPANDEARLVEAVNAGADDVIVKPINVQTLRVHLNTAMRMLLLRQEIQRERQGIMRSADEFASTNKRLLQDALTDTLTQLPNRRHGIDFLASECVFAQSGAATLAVLMLDIDHFKQVNDNFGHAAGDAVLRQLAELLQRAARSEDMVFRFGGEEFAAVLPNANQRTALQIGERIRSLVERSIFLWEGRRIPVTLSVGVAVSGDGETNGETLIRAADAALYKAKEQGRNRVVAAVTKAD